MVYVARTYDKVQRVDEMAAFCSDVLERAAASELASYSSGVSATSGMSSPMSPQATAAARAGTVTKRRDPSPSVPVCPASVYF